VAKAFADGYEQGVYQSISTEPIRPSGEERYSNPRSKCARLRWAVTAQPSENA
jgi:Predicted S-adenosylmethionine-dependent methyltransferase involved in cell envelope biogenesis